MVHSSYKLRRAIAAVLLVVYGTVGVLGYGLHELFHVHHAHAGHSHGAGCCSSDVSCCAQHPPQQTSRISHCHASGKCDHSHQVARTESASEEQLGLAAPEHDCAICEFLAQAQEIAPEASSAQLVEAVCFGPPASESLAPLYLPSEHLARGPPTC